MQKCRLHHPRRGVAPTRSPCLVPPRRTCTYTFTHAFARAHCVILLAGAAPASSVAQRAGTAFAADPPFLAPGDKVRIWIKRGPRVTGVLTRYDAPDSLTLERSQFFLNPLPPRVYSLYWIDVGRIDVPHGRDILGGALGGVGFAVGVGTIISLGCSAEGGQGCGVARWSVKAAPFTIPLGLVWGFFATRWRRVY